MGESEWLVKTEPAVKLKKGGLARLTIIRYSPSSFGYRRAVAATARLNIRLLKDFQYPNYVSYSI